MEELTTEVTEEDIKNGVEDEFGVVYSRDGKRLLRNNNRKLECYKIKNGTLVICNNAFNNLGYLLQKIIIPETVIMIGISAFKFCESLQQIVIPNSVTFISDYAFCGCNSIQEFVISNSISKIGDYSFCNCSSLQKIVIPDSVTTIGKYAFCNCNTLKQIVIPDSVTTIGDYAFYNCSSLVQLTIPNSIRTIGINPFNCCSNLNLSSKSSRFVIDNDCLTDNHNVIISYLGNGDSIVITNTITTILDSAFQNCNYLKYITIPNSVTEIGNRAFYDCISLQEIMIPNSVASINDEVFYHCVSLKSINIPNSVTRIGDSAFQYCTILNLITIPDSVTAIGEYAFWGCESLQHINIPNSVTTIGNFAFRDCKSLQQINIPDSVTTIGECIFHRCDSLKPIIASELSHRVRENSISSIGDNKVVKGLKIKRMKIKNFRAFVDEDIILNDFNCVIGKNDAGKSTIFSALEWFFDIDKELNENDLNSENVYFVEKLTQYDTLNPYEIVVEVYFCGDPIKLATINKDYLDNEGCVCIQKRMTFTIRDSKEKSNMKYSMKKFVFKQMCGKAISDCSFTDLCIEYKKIANQPDKLLDKIQQIETVNEQKDKGNSEIQNQIREKLYQYYSNSEREEQWSDSWFLKKIINSYKFNLYTSNTSLNNYLNDLLKIKYSASIEDTKSRMAKDLSKMLADNSVSESIRFDKNETIDLFNNDSLLLCSGNIPLNNRGEGIQLKIKNAVFKILTGIQSENQNTIFAFEEPETHLHPSAQIEMYETIKKMSENPNYQVFITTHSPYIVKQLAEDNIKPIVVKRDENLKESKISKLEERVLPYISMNEINYIAFDEPSIEYHIELFGYIHNKLIYRFENDNSFKTYWNATMTKPNRNGVQTIVRVTSIKGVDVWFENCCAAKKYRWFETDNYGEERRTLPYCVRNNIDHPLKTDDASKANGHKAFVNNNKYFKQWIIAKSIEIMRNAILNNPDIFK